MLGQRQRRWANVEKELFEYPVFAAAKRLPHYAQQTRQVIPMNEWMNEISYSHVSSRSLFRALNIESNLARPVIIQIPAQSHGRYTTELPMRRIKLFFIPSKFALCAKYSHNVDFLGSRRMETAPTSIEVLSRPALGQSDELSDLRGSLSPTTRHCMS